jgi:sugar phosphate isomerase/epimerase
MRTLSLAAGTILDVDPAAAVDVAADAGFTSVGIWFDAATWSDAVADEVRRRSVARGVSILDIEPVMLMPAGSGAVDHGDAIVDAAVRVGARNVLVASRDTDDARVAQRLRGLADRLDRSAASGAAGARDVRIVLEFLPILGVRTLPQALAIIAAADHPRIGLLVDSLHLSRAGHLPADLDGVAPRLMPYLQVCDAPAVPDDASIAALLHEALHARLLPGDGGLPIGGLLAAVPDVPISLELRSQQLRDDYPDAVDRARAVRLAMERVLAREITTDEGEVEPE